MMKDNEPNYYGQPTVEIIKPKKQLRVYQNLNEEEDAKIDLQG